MPLFFTEQENIFDNTLLIVGDDARHIARSLRMAEGDRLDVSSGGGEIYRCHLTKIRDEQCELAIDEKCASNAESPLKITLFMAYPKSDKLETVIQKSAELGVYDIIPFESKRCIKRPGADKSEKRLTRLNRIAREACSQCGRATLVRVHDTLSFPAVIERAAEYDLSLFCYEGEGAVSIKELLGAYPNARRIAVIVGSEGGFAPEEAALAAERGLSVTNLGPRILRCETAPLYVLSALSYHCEL